MKQINDFLNIKCGKQINEFINPKNVINQSLYDNNGLFKSSVTTDVLDKQSRTLEFKFPVLSGEFGNEMTFKKWKTMNIQPGPFYVYQDLYRNQLHVGCLGDLEITAGSAYNDFEDFSPKNIIAGFSTLKEAVAYMLLDCGYTITDINNIIEDKENTSNHRLRNYHDCADFADTILRDELGDKGYLKRYADDEDALEIVSWSTTVHGLEEAKKTK